MERALAESRASCSRARNLGKGQVKAADYFLEPNIVSANSNSAAAESARRPARSAACSAAPAVSIGGLAGGINVKKGEANVTLSIVNARTTEEEALTEGYPASSDLSWGAGGGAGWWGGFAAAGASGYQNTEIGQIIVLAYLDAYKKLVDPARRHEPAAPASTGAVAAKKKK